MMRTVVIWKIAIILFIIIVVIFAAPWADGLYFEKRYKQFLTIYNLEGHFQFKLVRYERGWFTSRASLVIDIIKPESVPFFKGVDIPSALVPKQFLVDQFIVHGPIIYQQDNPFPFRLGFVKIINVLHNTIELKNFLLSLKADNSPLPNAENFVTFKGSYFTKIRSGGLDLSYLSPSLQMKFSQMRGEIWVWPYPSVPHVVGNIYFENLQNTSPMNSDNQNNWHLHFNKLSSDTSWAFDMEYVP